MTQPLYLAIVQDPYFVAQWGASAGESCQMWYKNVEMPPTSSCPTHR